MRIGKKNSRLDLYLAAKKQNIERSKSLLNSRINTRKDLAEEIEKSSDLKNRDKNQDVNNLKKYLTSVKIKKKIRLLKRRHVFFIIYLYLIGGENGSSFGNRRDSERIFKLQGT